MKMLLLHEPKRIIEFEEKKLSLKFELCFRQSYLCVLCFLG